MEAATWDKLMYSERCSNCDRPITILWAKRMCKTDKCTLEAWYVEPQLLHHTEAFGCKEPKERESD